jgi:hypothetical protein
LNNNVEAGIDFDRETSAALMERTCRYAKATVVVGATALTAITGSPSEIFLVSGAHNATQN